MPDEIDLSGLDSTKEITTEDAIEMIKNGQVTAIETDDGSSFKISDDIDTDPVDMSDDIDDFVDDETPDTPSPENDFTDDTLEDSVKLDLVGTFMSIMNESKKKNDKEKNDKEKKGGFPFWMMKGKKDKKSSKKKCCESAADSDETLNECGDACKTKDCECTGKPDCKCKKCTGGKNKRRFGKVKEATNESRLAEAKKFGYSIVD